MSMPSLPNSPKTKFKSEYNTGVWDFGRLDEILKKIDETACAATCLDKQAVLPYFAANKQLYQFLRPFITLSWKKFMTNTFDATCDTLWLDVLEWHNEYRANPQLTDFPLGLVKQLDIFHSNLLTVKQTFGFGLVMNRETSTKTKIRQYMRVVGVKGGQFDKRIKV